MRKGYSLIPGNLRVFAAAAAVLFAAAPAFADGFPPYWDDSTGAVHFIPMPWPDESAWTDYSHQGIPIIDQRIADPSNGGRAPQNYVNVSSSCSSGSPDQVAPSVGWLWDDGSSHTWTEPTLFFRWLVEQIPNTYATGPLTQPYSSVDPWKAAQWTVLIDIDGDGFREFAVNIAGMSGTPSAPVDVVRSIYSDTRSQSIDFYDSGTGKGDPNIHLLFHNPTAFVYNSYGGGDPWAPYQDYILNFQDSYSPTPVWPNGSAETVWDYGMTRVRDVSTDDCDEFVVDYQIPLAMLDASSVGGPKIDGNTPMCLAYVTANSNENPLQKDFSFDGTGTLTPEDCVPCGDLITLAGGTIVQPVVEEVTATGCGTTDLTALVRDAVNLGCQDSLTSVAFYYYRDRNGNGIDDDGGSWTLVPGAVSVDTANPGSWSLSGWDTTSLDAGQYLVGVQALDDAVSGNANRTFSYYTTAGLPAPAAGETNYANPAPSPGVIVDNFLNTCGETASLTKSVSPAYTGAGSVATFTLSISNDTSAAFDLTSITDALPAGFSYQYSAPPAGASAEGGTLAGSIAARPTDGDTGSVTWTFNPGTSIGAGAAGTLTFTAQVAAAEGTYSNTASAVTSDADWGSLASNTVDIGVGVPQLSIAKTPSAYKAVPGDTITYTITYSNDSPVSTTGTVITDTLPPGLNFVAASGGGAYDAASRQITWDVGDLASGDGPFTVSYQVLVDQGADPRTENTATIDSAETAPATATTAIYVPSPLQIDKTANKVLVDPAAAPPGNQVTFSTAYRNTGTAALTGAAITDTTMPGFTFTSCTASCTAVEPSFDGYGNDDGSCDTGEPCTVTWALADPLNAGASGLVDVTLTVTNPYSGPDNPAVNTAVIDTNETGAFEDSASVVVRDYDCGATKDRYYFHDSDASGLPYPWTGAAPGTPLPATQRRGYATDAAPASPTAIDVVANITDGSEIELAHFYQDPPLDRPSGFSITGTVDMQAYMSKDAGGKVDILCYLYDYDPDTGESVQIGSTAADSGAGNRSNYLLTFSVTPTGIVREGNLLMWRFSTMRTGSYTGPVTFHYDGTASQAFGEVCFAPLSVTMNKTVDKLEATAGQTLRYTISFTNSGQQGVTGATIADTLPVGVTYNSATLNGVAAAPVGGSCTAGSPCTFDIRTSDNPAPWPAAPAGSGGTLSGGQSGTLVINVTIGSPLPAGTTSLTNIARLYTDSTDPVEDTATTDITHTPTPDIFLQKTADMTLLNPGDRVTYTITAVNVGDATASSIAVTDTIPAETWFTYTAGSITGEGGNDAGLPDLSWTITSLAPGESAVLTFQMDVASSGVPAGVSYKDNGASATEGPRTTSSNTLRVAVTTNANIDFAKSVASPVSTASVGTGDGSTTVFDASLAGTPLQAGSVEVFASGTRVGIDSGTGTIIGGGLAGSTIDYATGALHLEFLAAPAAAAALTASYRAELAPGATVQYAMTVTSSGGSAATAVQVADPVPAGATYVTGSLLYDGAAQTDAVDGDSGHFDAVQNRVVFTPGDMAVDATHSLKFSVVLDGSFGDGSTTVTNTAAASASNTAGRSSSADVVVSTAPQLAVSKSAPKTVAYPLATLSAQSNAGTSTMTFVTPPGNTYLNAGDRIYVPTEPAGSRLRTVSGISGTTQITLASPLVNNAPAATAITPVIKYTITYANYGTASAPSVRVKDILPVGLNYLSATPAPGTAPAADSNGYLTWNLGTLEAGATGTIVVYTRPTAAGTYLNGATMSASTVPEFASNTVTTAAGGLLVRKSTSTATVTNDPADGTPETGTYTITLTPQLAPPVTGVNVTDVLPVGFTYQGPTAAPYGVANGSCTAGPASGDAIAEWTGCTITTSPMSITFNVDIVQTVSAGVYQNPAEVTADIGVLPFDELITTAEDLAVVIPGDLKVTKAVTQQPYVCAAPSGTCVDYRVTVTNTGTAAATGIVVNDSDTDFATWPPANLLYFSSTPSAGSFASGTGAWSVAGPLASGTSATLDITFEVTSFAGTLWNCAARTASTPADSNPANDAACVPVVPTRVTLSGFDVREESGRVVAEWTTSSETETAGFHLLRRGAGEERFRRVTGRLLPAMLDAPQGGTYRFVDETADADAGYAYLLVEVERTGNSIPYGPYRYVPGDGLPPAGGSSVAALRGAAQAGVGAGAGFERTPRGISAGKARRLEASRLSRLGRLSKGGAVKGDAVNITVGEDGLYWVGADRIALLLGLDEGRVRKMIGAGRFSLSSLGSEVAWLPAEGGRGLYFYGRKLDSIYSEANVYRLAAGRGLLMETVESQGPPRGEVSTFRDRIHVEEDRMPLTSTLMGPDEDYWFWAYLFGGYPGYEAMEIPFTLGDLPPAAGAPAVLEVDLLGYSSTPSPSDFHVALRVNGAWVAEETWDGPGRRRLSVAIDQSLLREGENRVEVRALADPGVPFSIVYVDSLDLTCERRAVASGDRVLLPLGAGGGAAFTAAGFSGADVVVLDVEDPLRPRVDLSPTVFFDVDSWAVTFRPPSPGAPVHAVEIGAVVEPPMEPRRASTLGDRRNRADYVVVAPEAFAAAAAAFADYRRGQGLETMTVTVEEIYDEFAWGIETPAAIAAFLRHAWAAWRVPPRYVLLVGDGTFDYRDNLGYGENLIPAPVAATPLGLFPSDSLYGDVDGDHLPEMAVGRLPVLTLEEAEALFLKTRSAEEASGGSVVMLSDNADAGGDYLADSYLAASLVPPFLPVRMISLESYDLAAARHLVRRAWDEGALLVNYIGHGGLDRLAAEGLILTADVPDLRSAARLPVVSAFTCMAGEYTFPGHDSLSEALLLGDGCGAAAVWSPSGLSYNALARELNAGFFEGAFGTEPGLLGDAVLRAYERYRLGGGPVFMMDIYNLLGDPALRLR